MQEELFPSSASVGHNEYKKKTVVTGSRDCYGQAFFLLGLNDPVEHSGSRKIF